MSTDVVQLVTGSTTTFYQCSDNANHWTQIQVGGVNSQTIGYTPVMSDCGKLIVMNGSGLTLTLPSPPLSVSCSLNIENLNATTLTVSRNGLNIDGAAANLVLNQNQGVTVTTDGTNYFTQRGVGGGGGLSGMTAGQIPVAATSSTVTSSKAQVGTDTGILTAGTVGTLQFAGLCTTANGGASTTGCLPADGLDQTNLVVAYLMPPSEQSTTTLTDYSGNGFNGTFGATTHAPTRLASGSISCNAANTQFVSIPSGVGGPLTWMFVYTWNAGDNFSGTHFSPLVAQNTTPPANTVDYFGFLTSAGSGTGFDVFENSLDYFTLNTSAVSGSRGSGQGTHVLAFVGDTVDRFYLDGVEVLQDSPNSNSGHYNPSPNTWQLCGGSFNSSWATEQIHAVVAWSTALAPAAIARNSNILAQMVSQKGVKTPNNGASGSTSTTDSIVFAGDSIMEGFDDNINSINAWPSTIALTNSANLWNQAIAGTQIIAQQFPNIPQNDATMYSNSAGRNGVLINGGRNDLAVAIASLTSVEGAMSNYCRQTHLNGQKCLMVSLVSCQTTNNCTAANKNTLNAYYRLHWKEFADILVDWGGDPNVGCDSCSTGSFFRGDGIHPNSYSNRTILAHIAQKALNILYGPKDFTTATTYNSAAASATATTNATQSGHTATITFGTNSFTVGQFLTCSGITPAGYNTTFRVLTSVGGAGGTVTGWLNTTGLGNQSVAGSCSAPQQNEEAYSILNFGTGAFNMFPCDGITGTRINIKNINANSSTITAYNTSYETDLIDGAATLSIAQNQVRILEAQTLTPSTPTCSWVVIQ